MITLRTQVTIAAHVDRVFSALIAVEHMPDWVDGLDMVEQLPSHSDDVLAAYVFYFSDGNKKERVIFEVIRKSTNNEFTLRLSHQRFTGMLTLLITPMGQRTEIITLLEFKPLTLKAMIIFFLLRPIINRRHALDFIRFKKMLEV